MDVLHAEIGKEPPWVMLFADDLATRSCAKCRHLEKGTHVPDGGIPQTEEIEMVWACAKAIKLRPRERYYK